MAAIARNLEDPLVKDLAKKFVFLTGPRQVGKTTLAKQIIAKKKGRYLLYDDDDDRRIILEKGYRSSAWVCLDEFHKFPRWKAHLKGVFDKYHPTLHCLLTGSARLDVFQKSGDSLFGRYYLHHLHPLSGGELHAARIPVWKDSPPLEPHEPIGHIPELLRFGGFPEPFGLQSDQEHRRWSNMRRQLLVREDLREITQVHLIGLMEQLMLVLPQRIGSLFSERSLAEDIRVSPPTIRQWMDIFQRLFMVFKITPYSRRIIRSLQRQPKYYFVDWSQIPDEGHRFENLVASHLWKAVQIWTDLGEANLDLHYIRDRDRREVDFLITRERQPWLLVECKRSETEASDGLKYFCRRLGVPGLQVVLKENVAKKDGSILLVSANRWLAHLP